MTEPFYGQVVARQGKRARVWIKSLDEVWSCHTRRQQLNVVCGDWVTVGQIADMQGVVESCEDRRTVFSRTDELRTKTIAANVDQVMGVLAWDPLPSESLLMRWMIVAHTQGVPFVCIVNKQDLAGYLPEHPLREWMPKYRKLGVACVETSACSHPEAVKAQLWSYLENKNTLFVGQSGAGKSSLINALIPGLNLETRELSEAIGGGRHTTTTTQTYWLAEDKKTAVMDSPGMQTFGMHGLTKEGVLHACPDIRPYLGKCRFRNCQHDQEPDCAVLKAVERGDIDEERWDILREVWAELV